MNRMPLSPAKKLKKTLRDIPIRGKRLLTRVDFNCPQEADGSIADDLRIRETIPTLRYALENGASLVLMSHLGRPKGEPDVKFKMDPVAKRLEELLGRPVIKLSDCVGPVVKEITDHLKPGQVVLLENLRFHPGEEKNDSRFAKSLAQLGDIFVNDAFGTCHRAHASTEGVASYLPAVSGFLLEKEIKIFSKLLVNPEHPFVAIIGGAKVAGKIDAMMNLMNHVDTFLIAGRIGFTMLRTTDYPLGNSGPEEDKLDVARAILEEAKKRKIRIILPVDHVSARKVEPGCETIDQKGVQDGWMAADIGTQTLALFKRELEQAKTVLWNGPVGVFEVPPFNRGTQVLAESLVSLAGTTVIGGGDTARSVREMGFADRMTHVSTGGGAGLEILEGKEFPGIKVLQDRDGDLE
jgi:phosphoglycerate kinase